MCEKWSVLEELCFSRRYQGVVSLRFIECDVEILTFIVDEGAYYFVASDGRRADIVKCSTHQPEIREPDDYFYYMWVSAVQGYFLLRQRFLEGKAQPWHLVAEIETERRDPAFFDELEEVLIDKISRDVEQD